jgi:hypothetical protein
VRRRRVRCVRLAQIAGAQARAHAKPAKPANPARARASPLSGKSTFLCLCFFAFLSFFLLSFGSLPIEAVV